MDSSNLMEQNQPTFYEVRYNKKHKQESRHPALFLYAPHAFLRHYLSPAYLELSFYESRATETA